MFGGGTEIRSDTSVTAGGLTVAGVALGFGALLGERACGDDEQRTYPVVARDDAELVQQVDRQREQGLRQHVGRRQELESRRYLEHRLRRLARARRDVAGRAYGSRPCGPAAARLPRRHVRRLLAGASEPQRMGTDRDHHAACRGPGRKLYG